MIAYFMLTFFGLYGTEIAKVLPPMPRFSKDNERTIKKNIVIDKILEFFNRFVDITNNKFK